MKTKLILSLFILTGCTNFALDSKTGGSTGSNSNSSLNFQQHNTKISNINVASTSASEGAPDVKIFFDSSQDFQPISKFCEAGESSESGVKTCACQFSWTEKNTAAGSGGIPRSVETALGAIQTYAVSCSGPSVWNTEIVNGTSVKVKVIAKSEANAELSMDLFSYTKGMDSTYSDFTDAEGRKFQNIKHYSCYEKSKRGMKITSYKKNFPNSDTTSDFQGVDVFYATKFCFSDSKGQVSADCTNVAGPEYSSQSYYYNLYAPSAATGFTIENQRYSCPIVKEVGNGSVGEQGQPWPMDATFGLAQGYDQDFSVPVEANSVLSVEGDPTTASNTCFGSLSGEGSSGSTSSNTIATKCLGFAKKPEKDGSCKPIQNDDGSFRTTYRLRRFMAIYPPQTGTSGEVLKQAIAADLIYVLDRPVNSGDPDHPYTMMGPKPCPFAYLDARGALGKPPVASYSADGTGGRPIYKGTNEWGEASVSGQPVNVDNINFPYFDSKSKQMCAALMPIVTYSSQGDPQGLTFGTTHPSNTDSLGQPNMIELGGFSQAMTKIPVRPVNSWAPHYVEDKSYLACAPQAAPFIDPPLHFAKDNTGNIAYCAEVYPTQSDAVEVLDKKLGGTASDPNPGYFYPATSHVAKNSPSSCNASLPALPSNYPVDSSGGASCNSVSGATIDSGALKGVARHPAALIVDAKSPSENLCSDRTCDRTVVNAGNNWKGYPLLAPAASVEKTLRNDSSYRCEITYDAGNGKANKGISPSEGCCSSAVIKNLKTGGAGGPYDAAHLEDSDPCVPPNY